MARGTVETTVCTPISPVGFRKVEWLYVWAVRLSDLLFCHSFVIQASLPSRILSALIRTVGTYVITEERLYEIVTLAGNRSSVSELLVVSSPPQECDWVTGANGFLPYQSSPKGGFSKPGTDLSTPQL